jgi:hypothetical protein
MTADLCQGNHPDRGWLSVCQGSLAAYESARTRNHPQSQFLLTFHHFTSISALLKRMRREEDTEHDTRESNTSTRNTRP